MTIDPNRRLVMASFKTVLGHSLPVGHPLTIVEEPTARGEVDEALANRLLASKIAGYEDEVHATPVETPEQEKNRLALEALRDNADAPTDELAVTNDLLVWQTDDEDTGKKAGQKVTNEDLRVIAGREGVVIETDDNKADLQRKIMEVRASRALQNGTNAETDGAGGQGDTLNSGSTGAGANGGADGGPDGDAHGAAGEGQSDADAE